MEEINLDTEWKNDSTEFLTDLYLVFIFWRINIFKVSHLTSINFSPLLHDVHKYSDFKIRRDHKINNLMNVIISMNQYRR